MATIKLAEEFENWASQFVDMSEALYDLPMLDDEEVEKIAEGFSDKDGNMSQHDWEEFAEVIQGALSEKIFGTSREAESMKIDAKFFCNHCGSTFSAKDTEQASIRCPVCDGYKVSLQLDLWNEPDVEDFPDPKFDSEGIPE